MTKVVASGQSDDEIVENINEQVLRVENNDFLRASAHLTVCHALLYVAVEGWRKWKFFDARVDKLLESPRANELKKYRHAIFHADHFDHEDVEQFGLANIQDQWSGALQNELRRALRDWHANLDQRITEYLRRSPL